MEIGTDHLFLAACLREVSNELAATAIGIKRLQCGLHHVISDGLQNVRKIVTLSYNVTLLNLSLECRCSVET